MTKYRVSFQYSETIYCTNIAIAKNIQDVENHYNKYNWYNIEEATDCDIKEAERKGMPIITINHIEENQEGEKMEDTRTVEEIKEEIKAYFENNEEEFNEVIEDLDSYNGYLGDDCYYNMEDLDEFYRDTEPTELLNRAFYGYDADTWTTDGSGNKTYGAFNPNRDYFTYNGYGNLISTDYKDYSDKLDDYFIDALIEDAGNLYSIPDTIQELIEELEEIEA